MSSATVMAKSTCASDPNWTSGLISRIRPKLIEEGIEEFPSPSYVARSEWPSLAKQWQRRNPELKLDTP